MTRILWIAGKDGQAHAYRWGRTLCHAPSIAERDAWPRLTYCPRCEAMLAEVRP
jgi:hypothetical protein